MKKIILSLILSLSVFFLSAQVDRSKPPVSGPAPEINLGKPKTFSLKNGLKVIVVENSKLPRAFANLEIDNYPDYEGNIKGVSSLVSSMMGNGTENQSKEDYNEASLQMLDSRWAKQTPNRAKELSELMRGCS